MAKLDARLELRLDKQTYVELERRAAVSHVTVAQLVRQAIARELGGDDLSWREQALDRAFRLELPVPQDPAELVRELNATHDLPMSSSTGEVRSRSAGKPRRG